jgi:hypothetical protein
VITNDKFVLLAVRQKDMTPLPFRFCREVYSPPQVSGVLLERIYFVCRKASLVAGFSDCMIHFDVIADKMDEPIIIETSGRPSGFHISAMMLPAMLGYSPIEKLMRRLLGLSFDFTPVRNRASILKMLEARPGTVVQTSGFEEARQVPGVVASESYLVSGEEVLRQNCGSVGFKVGYVVAEGETLIEARGAVEKALTCISFEIR